MFSANKLDKYIKRVTAAKEEGRKKSPAEYALLKRYDVARIGEGQTFLIKKNSVDPYIRYIKSEEIFDYIYDAHVGVCHGGQKRTHHEVKKTVANITREQVSLFLSYCVICEEKRAVKKSRQFQDHFTKFCVLRPLHSKQVEEVARQLYDIFTLIGAPKILQSDNGSEFVGAPLKEMMKKYWPATQFVHGSPRYPQSQGSVERANGDVKKMLCGITREMDTCNWADLLMKVQWAKNNVRHRVIGMTPYKILFGQAPISSMKIAERVSNCLF